MISLKSFLVPPYHCSKHKAAYWLKQSVEFPTDGDVIFQRADWSVGGVFIEFIS